MTCSIYIVKEAWSYAICLNFPITQHTDHLHYHFQSFLAAKVIIFLFPLDVYALTVSVWSNLMFFMRNSYTPKLWVITHWHFEITHLNYYLFPVGKNSKSYAVFYAVIKDT